MRINVTELLKETGTEFYINDNIYPASPFDEVELDGPINANLRLLNTGEGIIAKGNINAAIKLSCARCLKEFYKDLKIDVEEQFKKDDGSIEDDLIFPISPDNFIDLDEMIRQNILTEIPIKAICSEECKVG